MKNRPLCSACLILFILMCTVILTGKERVIKELRPSPAERSLPDGEEILLTGRVYKKESRDDYQILYLKNNSIEYQNQFIKESRIIIYDEEKTELHIGQGVKLKGTISFYEPAYNPGNFDRRLYYQRQNIHAFVWAYEVKAADGRRAVLPDRLYRLRQNLKRVFEKNMSKEDGAVLSAMILGEKGEMDEGLRELYRMTGVGHSIVISGLHLSFIGIGIYQFLRKMTGSFTVGGAAGILFLMLYILMIGFSVSVVRALVMFLFRVGADITGRHYDAPTALSMAALVVLIWRPLCLYDGGFWLSFGAVLAILTVVPVLQEWTNKIFVEKEGRRICAAAMQGFTASAGIDLVLFPIMLYYFFEFPVYSFLLNLFVIPFMSVILFMGMMGSLFSVCFLSLSSICFGVCRGILRLYKIGCNLAIMLPGARFVAGQPKLWQILVYYGMLALALYLLKNLQNHHSRNSSVKETGYSENEQEKVCGFRWKKRLAVLLWATGLFVLVFRWGETGKLTTVILDVGQGDGIFIKGPDGGTYLIDGGSSDVKKVGQYRLEPFLKSQGAGTLAYVLVSHGDSDHISGIEELIERRDIGVRIKTLVLPTQEVWDETLTGLAEKAGYYGIRVVTIEAGQSIKEGKMTLTCIQPGNMEMEPAKGTELPSGNAASMVLAVRYGEFDMLLTGDVEEEGEEQLTKRLEERYQDCRWEVLKVAHHGSKNSSLEEFLAQVQPAYAFISAGRENRYGHPHQETIERLMDAGSKIYSTQENGAIIVKVEQGRILKIQKY